MIDYFIGLSLLRGEENVKKWETESTEPWFIDGEWQSVYRLKQSKRKITRLFQRLFLLLRLRPLKKHKRLRAKNVLETVDHFHILFTLELSYRESGT